MMRAKPKSHSFTWTHTYTPCTALAINDERGCMARLCVIKVRSHHAAPMPITLAESSMTDRLQAGRSGLQMSSCPGTVIPRWRTSSSSRVRVSKVSTFRYVSWTVHSPYLTLNLRRPSFYGRRCMDLEQSSAAYHICSVTSCLLLSFEDVLLWTLLSIITVLLSYPQSDTVIFMDKLIALYIQGGPIKTVPFVFRCSIRTG